MANEKVADDFGLIADTAVGWGLTTAVNTAVTVTVAGTNTATIDTLGYDWVDYFFTFSNITGAFTTLEFTPYSVVSAFGLVDTLFPFPYEPAVAAMPAIDLLYQFQYAPGAVTHQTFRLPVIGPKQLLNMVADADTVDVAVWAFRRKNGGPKSR